MSERPLQYFSDEALTRSRKLSPEQTLRYLEGFRLLQREPRPEKARLISVRVPQAMLDTFKAKSARAGVPYQTQLKRLMTRWLEEA